ncbi:DUF937 domain-containing protein [Leptolyngbya sp. BL0902]|uniref:DUF937 domain-containing protein n=1 Tax=Leptolyngbya sp. BL0902 TaxID=1115757 RepID=UPI0018E8D087|nr:DUF937 domain-containing protein [Leptolyngbya sp. BL0902]QQE63811.1 DUF937 domain-containing protein [Leptolyngbya sp. BL0902]
MSLFFDVLTAINNPHQQGSVDQLGSVVEALQQLASRQGLEMAQMIALLDSLGQELQPILQDQASAIGVGALEGLLGKLSGAGSLGLLQVAIPRPLQQEIIQAVAQQTGIQADQIQAMLPQLIPAIMGLLGMGAAKPGTSGQNVLLEAFLKSEPGQSTDLGTVINFATRFLNPPAQA